MVIKIKLFMLTLFEPIFKKKMKLFLFFTTSYEFL